MNNKIKVFARIKPPKDSVSSHVYEIKANKVDNGRKKILLLRGVDEKFCVNSQHKLHDAEEFLFENIFTEEASQENIYNTMAKPVIERAIEGFNGTIMAYGQTGTGKTHTICGGRDKGIIPRAFKDVLHAMKEIKQSHKVFLSVMEIYNEHAYDLLNGTFAKIGLGRDKTKQLNTRNLTTVQVYNMHQLDKLLRKAWNNRIVSETPMNDASSRSHCIFSLHLHQSQNNKVMISKVHMIDLSGSEKLGKRRPSGILLNETRHINLSLHYIELVIRALSDKNREHIPYRNSMITSFLRDSLGGNSNTVMVFTLSLEPMFFEETILTCRFSQRVSLISNKMKKQISQNQDMEFIKGGSKLIKNNDLETIEPVEPSPAVIPNNHKGINCKLDSTSVSSSSNCQYDTDQMSMLDDEDFSKYIDEILPEEDTPSVHYCYESHEKEERDILLELKSVQTTLNELSTLTEAFKTFSVNALDTSGQNSDYLIYDRLGLCLPPVNHKTGTMYTLQEKDEFQKFVSRTFDISSFKSEYYDEYCDLLTKEYHAFSAWNKTAMHAEKLKNKMQMIVSKTKSDQVDQYKSELELKECKLKQKEEVLENVKKDREKLLKKVEDLKTALIDKFHKELLPNPENRIKKIPVKYICKSSEKNNNEEPKPNTEKTKRRVNIAPRKSISNVNEYRTSRRGVKNSMSDSNISRLSRGSKISKSSTVTE